MGSDYIIMMVLLLCLILIIVIFEDSWIFACIIAIICWNAAIKNKSHQVYGDERLCGIIVLRSGIGREWIFELPPGRIGGIAHLLLPVARHGSVGSSMDALHLHARRRHRLSIHALLPRRYTCNNISEPLESVQIWLEIKFDWMLQHSDN